MKCDYCDSKATVFLTQLAEGQMKKVCLCDGCAKERGVTDPTGFSLADMLLGNFDQLPGGNPAKRSEKAAGSDRNCPACGFGFGDFQKVRRFGCGECYRFFSEELNPMLRGMHKGMSHVGKVPKGLMESHFRNQKLDDLRIRLEQAIATESYEAAADIRDEIRTLEEVSK
ncbi:UvrB/UvrC motif-containing protein [Akkermansiaceae bacterium]|nr:UvrB/UvrC motif-containing protein [Akkermansiaceae bacterium]